MIELGDKVKDKITKFTGIAIGEIRWLYGCKRWVVQPEVDKDGKHPQNHIFDEQALEIVEKAVAKPAEPETKPPTGGPIQSFEQPQFER